jgi:2',3'-cyclic-nucleotide 2'-phosphodiesterase/3'-nucleotidase/5'-nucleotidase
LSSRLLLLSAAVAAFVAAFAFAGLASADDDRDDGDGISLSLIGRYTGGGAEIGAYDARSKRLFVTDADNRRVDILSLALPSSPSLVNSILLAPGSPNSVAVHKGLVAIAVEAAEKTNPGSVSFYDTNGNFLKSVQVGALPDMLTFTRDGDFVLVANEGEPNDAYTIDPEGSVSVIDLDDGVKKLDQHDVRTADFDALPPSRIEAGVRIFGANSPTAAEDFEPEHIATGHDSDEAWVGLQENNAIALLDVENARFRRVEALGFKNHALSANAFDASDRDGPGTGSSSQRVINIANWSVFGIYQPDGLAAFEDDDDTFLVTANEGDARAYPGFNEEARVSTLDLDDAAFPNEAALKNEDAIGRLTITTALGNTDADTQFEQLYAFGGRSFSIWSERGSLVFDSGDAFEQITAAQVPSLFNANGEDPPPLAGTFDTRSDNKGPEPEGLVLGEVKGTTYAFIGLERIGGVMVYDLSRPRRPEFVQYVNPQPDVDLAPEGLAFIERSKSPTGEPLLVVTNEISGTTTIYAIDS